MPVQNRGRQINFLTGITGVSAGGQAVINMPVNLRLHRLKLQCYGICYTAPVITGTNPTNPLPAGAITATVVNGVITGFTIVTSALVTANGTYAMTITDPSGFGASGTFTVASNVITATALTSGGTVAPVPPTVFLNSIQHSINGVLFRDILPVDVLSILQSQGSPLGNPQLGAQTSQASLPGTYIGRPGELPIYFTEPWRNINQNNEITSWDLFGQSTYQIKFGIIPGVTSPQLNGVYEFDFQRNLRNVTVGGKTTQQPFLQPVRQHSFNIVVPSGRFDINYLPIDFPIARMWLVETGPGSIQQVELYQDGNKILEATNEQITEMYGDYGFNIGVPSFATVAQTFPQVALQANALTGQPAGLFNVPVQFYDAAFIADPDQRIGKALQVANQMILRVYSAAPTTLKVVIESLPGAFQ
jgi:hypothetical protein